MKAIITILLLIFIYNLSYSQSREVFLHDESRLKFGDYLFYEKDYLRAIDEYRFYLNSNVNDTIDFKIGYAYLQIAKYSRARSEFEQLFSSNNVSDFSKSYYLHSYFAEKDYLQFLNLANIISISNDIEKSNLQKKLAITNLLLSNNISEEQILKPFGNMERPIVQSFYNRVVNPEYKSSTWACIMSAIIPGSGKMYAGKISDGIFSFLLTGLFTYLAVDNFNKERSTRAWIFTGTAAFFYAGNIYGSVAAGQIYNAGIRFNFENDLELFLKKENYFLSRPGFLNHK